MSFSIVEIIGYIGTCITISCYLLTSLVKLRIVNNIGCAINIVYSICIGSVPVLILNVFIFIINCIQLIIFYKKSGKYDVVNADIDGFTLRHFISKNRSIILKENNHFLLNYPDCNYAKVVFCDDTVVAMLVAKVDKDKNMKVYLDLVDDNSTNIKLFHKMYEQAKIDGMKKIIIAHKIPRYNRYYEKVGFVNENGIYTLSC